MTRLRFIEVGPARRAPRRFVRVGRALVVEESLLPAHRRRAALLSTLDRGFSLISRIHTSCPAGPSLERQDIRVERDARVRRMVREAVERYMAEAACSSH